MMKKVLASSWMLHVVLALSLQAQCFELVWSEEFDSTGLPSEAIWNFETGGDGGGNNELQYYRKDSSNAYVDQGSLKIIARKETYGGRSFTSARIQTRGKIEVQYGKIEARMRLPYGQGIWPAFWMLGQNYPEVGWPACGEIDIMEMVGGVDGDNTVHGTNHWDYEGNHAEYGQSYTLEEGIFADSFHVFSVEWNAQAIRWFVDGVEFNVMSITGESLSEFHQPFFMILNLAVGGNWPGYPDATTVFPQIFEVDYVRVYKNLEEEGIAGPEQVGEKQAALSFSALEADSLDYHWEVPEDAQITSGQGSASIAVDWGCTEGEVRCQLMSDCDTFLLVQQVALNNQLQGPMFAAPGQEAWFHYHEMSESTYQWQVPADATILSGQGSDSILLRFGDQFGEVLLETSNACGTQSLALEVLREGSYPYPDPFSPHRLPGSLNPVDYNYGGEGVAYHDQSPQNEGDGDRQDEGVDTQNSDRGNPNVGWILDGEWLEYGIAVDSTWQYRLSIRVATPNASGGPISIWVNGEERLKDIPIPGTGAWDVFKTIYAGSLPLNEADTLLRLQFDGGGFNLARVSFNLDATNHLRDMAPSESLILYPNPAGERLYAESIWQRGEYQVMDVHGRTCLRASFQHSSLEIDLHSLKPGLYFLVVEGQGQGRQRGRFLKF